MNVIQELDNVDVDFQSVSNAIQNYKTVSDTLKLLCNFLNRTPMQVLLNDYVFIRELSEQQLFTMQMCSKEKLNENSCSLID